MSTNLNNNQLNVCNELLGIIDEQKNVITKQSEVISKMAIDNMEKENMINVLLEDCDQLY